MPAANRAKMPPMRILFLATLGLPALVLSSLACGGGNQGTGGSTSLSTSSSGGNGTGGSGGAVDPTPLDAPGISKSPASVEESEPFVAASSDGRIAVAWIGIAQTGISSITYAFSKDDGATWTPPAQVEQPNNLVGSDPVMVADEKGDIFLSWLGYDFAGQLPSNMRLYAAKSGPGTMAFAAPVVAHDASSDLYDKPWMTITQAGTLVISHTASDDMTYSHAIALTSADGAKWKAVTLPGASARSLVYVCASRSTPRLFATYLTQSNPLQIATQSSDDEGLTWGPEVISSGADAVGFDGPTCVADGNDVWVSYTIGTGSLDASNFQHLTAVRVAHSKDGGATFPPAVDAHDTATGKLFLHPFLALEADGSLDTLYYAGASAGDAQAGLLSVQSKDHGATFSPSVVQHSPIHFDLSRGDMAWLGDYFGVAQRDGHTHLAYVDNTSGISHVSYRRIPAAK
jgi:hypothetical protein